MLTVEAVVTFVMLSVVLKLLIPVRLSECCVEAVDTCLG